MATALVAAIAVWPAGAVATRSSAQVHVRVLRLVDRSRRVQYRNGTSGARILVTYVRYPVHAQGAPLVVFAHGFALTPLNYTALLDTWVRAGYVVAAPVFPVENAAAPGGADRSDLSNEPADISFVISRLIGASSPVRGLIDPTKIAVAGQSDGGVAALSVAYDRRYADRRIDAAMVMSGATLAGFRGPPSKAPPLLAVQGTSDPYNSPATTSSYYGVMRRPKFLLWLIGASHLPPYTTHDQWAPTVERTTTAFLDHELRGAPLRPLIAAGTRPGIARIISNP